MEQNTAKKKAYLKYYRKTRKKGQTPQKYGTWSSKQGETPRTGALTKVLSKSLSQSEIKKLKGK